MADIIREKLMIEIKLGKNVSDVCLNKSIIAEYLKWINYVPDWLDETLKDEQSIENKRRSIEQKYKPLFEKCLCGESLSPEETYDIYVYTKAVSIDAYAMMKLTKEEYNDCVLTNEAYRYKSGFELELCVIELDGKDNKTMKDEYLLHLLRRRINVGLLLSPFNMNKDGLNEKFKKSLDKNYKTRRK